MSRLVSALLAMACTVLLPLFAGALEAQPRADQRGGPPVGQLTWALHVTVTPAWLDPADHTAGITAMIPFYAIHDALVKPMPGSPMSPSLAESWSVSHDGLVYEFVLRRNVRFQNGDPMTAEDVKFSFERYRGVAAKLLREKVAAVEIVDPHRVRFRLKEPWPDFLAFYATPATGAAWIVPKKYVEKVGDEGYKKAPIGAGPYRLVAFNPGVDLVLEAFDGYWRKTPAVKRLVLRVVPDDSTRLAMLKRGEVDIAYALRGPLAEEVRRTPGLKLAPTATAGVFWLDLFAQQARETDRKKREALLHQIQKIAYDRAMFAPIWEFAQLQAVGPRVEEAGLGLIELMPFSAPYEDVRLKGR